MLKYANRSLTLAYVFGWALWATSRINEASPCVPVSWQAAWLFVLVLAGSVALGVFSTLEYMGFYSKD